MYCIETRSSNNAGYAWFTPVTMDPCVYEFHICVDPEMKGRWLTRGLLRQFRDVLDNDLPHPDRIIALHTDPRLRSVLGRLGFETHGSFVHILNLNEE